MILETTGIVTKTVKYGDTSLICTIYTEAAGLQSYMVKGARSAKHPKANTLYAGALLILQTQHSPMRRLQYIKQWQLHPGATQIGDSVLRSMVRMYITELLSKLVAEDDGQKELFSFAQNFLFYLNGASDAQLANLPLYFTIQASALAGYRLSGQYGAATPYISVVDGRFAAQPDMLATNAAEQDMAVLEAVMAAASPGAASEINSQSTTRQRLLDTYLQFLQYHLPHFSGLLSRDVLHTILS